MIFFILTQYLKEYPLAIKHIQEYPSLIDVYPCPPPYLKNSYCETYKNLLFSWDIIHNFATVFRILILKQTTHYAFL